VNPQFHDEFVALCALFHSGEISDEEWALLQVHMAYCDSCHERFLQYQRIASEVMPAMAGVMAADLDQAPKESAEALAAAEQRLLGRLKSLPSHKEASRKQTFSWRPSTALVAAFGVAIVCLVGIRFAHLKKLPAMQAVPPALDRQVAAPTTLNKPEADNEEALKRSQQDNANLRAQLSAAERQSRQANVAYQGVEKQLDMEQAAVKQLTAQRDALSVQLTTAQTEAQSLRNKLAATDTDTAQQGTRTTVLETRVRELSASLEEKDTQLDEKARMLDLDKELLAHDRDIRDVIGARNLYIADISDLTANGKTAKQFGRIFYTKDRSLVFYGFDLDSQAGHRQNVSFQAWGSGSTTSSPVSLGLFYQDDSHKRWVLRCDDPKTLAQLDMVFVTVEPQGGSAKPTGKQLLRAYLQIQPNHP
jgi:hypothetical protein